MNVVLEQKCFVDYMNTKENVKIKPQFCDYFKRTA